MKIKPSNSNKKKLGIFNRLVLGLSIFLSLALLISYLAPVTDPRRYWVIAFFGLAYPYLLLVNLVVLLYWLLLRNRYLLLPAITIIIGWPVLRNNIGFHFIPQVAASAYTPQQQFRIMTYNVHNFKLYGANNNDATTRHEILELIKEQHPDIIGFQEYYTHHRGRYNMTDSLKSIMHSSYYYFEPFSFNRPTDAMGLAIFSKYPIINQGSIHLSDDKGSENQCLFVDLKKNKQIIRIYSIHLQSIRLDPVDYEYLNKVSKQGKTSVNSSKRIGSKLKAAFIQRSEQVFKIKSHAAQCPYPYIFSGDFNDTPTSFAVNQMAKNMKNAFREKGTGLGRTYNGSFPNYQIDYIMTSPQLDVASYWVIPKKLSDHYPVCSDIVIR
ncbi:endonuclease/exonuclease/phosphatase family protein [Mucilaginibacter robiniae]|uniref:Endonuclease/exonuclease/phosphatase family protein n=1 Tax=Mucilaginibacter robiniae TaxID=2728022 RepID=A0A7L5DWA5_9SPHI|nr:endonuclease/exonuclease/phosphatase family protein [Mucilaginibacter robiniae]QJD95362.1 endonuclease/exonuclease/phosphatase family protein [Mucilaginibacter robiniae]